MFARICVLILLIGAVGGPVAAQSKASKTGQPPPKPNEPNWQTLAPPGGGANTPDTNGPVSRWGAQTTNDTGWGWCHLISDTHKKAYYSSVFQADLTTSGAPPGGNLTDYLSKFYGDFIKKYYAEGDGDPECQWWPYASQYSEEDVEQSDEFGEILKNYTVVKTQWHP